MEAARRANGVCAWTGYAANLFAAAIIHLAVFGPSTVAAEELRPSPEAASGLERKTLAIAHKHMIVAAHPRAADAGLEILRAGGSAVDAAIATQLVLGLVEPQSSGIGGGAFLVLSDATGNHVTTFDGRETAPAAALPDRFLRDGKPMEFEQAVRSGLSVGVPGVLKMLALAHARYGKLPWPRLFDPAIKLAQSGFHVSPRLNALLKADKAENFASAARSYFYDDAGAARPVGYLLKNPEYARTLITIAQDGASAFYGGPIAQSIVAAVAAAPIVKGDLAMADLSAYSAVERAPVCITYRGQRICGMPPPSSGGVAVLQTLALIEPFKEVQGAAANLSASALHVIAEAEKLAFADRNRYIADPAFVEVPAGLLDEAYLNERRRLIDPARAMDRAQPGLPPGLAKKGYGEDATHEASGTTQISIVDDDGYALSMTTTVESAFGSHLWASGFLLNNQLTDFSLQPADKDGVVAANAVGPGKRPRSSMAPTIVFDADGRPAIVTGSPGGSKIILYVVKTLIGLLDWKLDAVSAAALANFGSENGPFQYEFGKDTLGPAFDVTSFGQTITGVSMTSGIATIVRKDGHLEGGADPRREGMALGD